MADAKGESVSSGGEFVELDAEGQVGTGYVKLRQQRKKLSYMSSAELDATAEHLDVQWEFGTTTNVQKAASSVNRKKFRLLLPERRADGSRKLLCAPPGTAGN